MIRFLARAPVIHFLLIGALLFVVSQLSKDDVTRDPRPIVVDAQWTQRAEAAYLAAALRLARSCESPADRIRLSSEAAKVSSSLPTHARRILSKKGKV